MVSFVYVMPNPFKTIKSPCMYSTYNIDVTYCRWLGEFDKGRSISFNVSSKKQYFTKNGTMCARPYSKKNGSYMELV